MFKLMKAAMVAALALSVGTAWAMDEDIQGSFTSPTLIDAPDGAPSYTDGNTYYWGTTETTDPVFGNADSLVVAGGSGLVIGTDATDAASAPVDMIISFPATTTGTGVITVGTSGAASTGGTISIGHDSALGTSVVGVDADELRMYNGLVAIQSNAAVDATDYNYLSVGTLNMYADDASTWLVMDNGNTGLWVKGAAYIGSDADTAYTATVSVAGDKIFFDAGMSLLNGGVLQTNATGIDATVYTGSYDAVADEYVEGDIFMTGGAAINANGNTIEIVDWYAAQEGDGSLSMLFVTGLENRIMGDIVALGSNADFALGNYDAFMDMQVGGKDEAGNYIETSLILGSDVAYYDMNELYVRDYLQVNGDVYSGIAGGSTNIDADWAVINVLGTQFDVLGGTFAVSVNFANDDAFDANVDGSSWKRWEEDQFAVIEGQAFGIYAQWFQGRDADLLAGDKVQQFFIGKNAVIDVTDGSSDYYDLDVVIDKEGDVVFSAEGGMIGLMAGYYDLGSTITIVDKGSVKFDLDLLNDVYGDLAALAPGATHELIWADDDSVIIAPEFTFSGMFGDFAVGYDATGDAYGITGYQNLTGVVFDGTYDDADRAWDSLWGAYGNTVQLGLSDMAYRAVLEADGPEIDMLDIVANPTDAQTDSFFLSMLNLYDIASGRADKSTVGLYNGSAAFGVNQVSASTALSHVQIGLRRSDEIRKMNNLVRNSVSGNDAYAASIMNNCYTNRFWAGGFGLWEDADSRRGFDGYKYKSGGVAVGYDRMFGPNFIVGASFAATFGDYEDKTALAHDSDIDSYSFNLYATYTHNSGFFGSVFGGYTYSDNDIRELRLSELNNRLWNEADYHTNTWTLGAKLGYDWKPVERFSITPSVGITWINARSSAHNEYLDDVAAVHYSKMKTNQTYLPVELAFGYDAYVCNDRKLNLALNLGYAYNFDNDAIKGTVSMPWIANDTPYSAVSREPGHHTFTIGGGLRYTMGRFDIGAKYDYARKAKMDSHRVYGTVGISF